MRSRDSKSMVEPLGNHGSVGVFSDTPRSQVHDAEQPDDIRTLESRKIMQVLVAITGGYSLYSSKAYGG